MRMMSGKQFTEQKYIAIDNKRIICKNSTIFLCRVEWINSVLGGLEKLGRNKFTSKLITKQKRK